MLSNSLKLLSFILLLLFKGNKSICYATEGESLKCTPDKCYKIKTYSKNGKIFMHNEFSKNITNKVLEKNYIHNPVCSLGILDAVTFSNNATLIHGITAAHCLIQVPDFFNLPFRRGLPLQPHISIKNCTKIVESWCNDWTNPLSGCLDIVFFSCTTDILAGEFFTLKANLGSKGPVSTGTNLNYVTVYRPITQPQYVVWPKGIDCEVNYGVCKDFMGQMNAKFGVEIIEAQGTTAGYLSTDHLEFSSLIGALPGFSGTIASFSSNTSSFDGMLLGSIIKPPYYTRFLSTRSVDFQVLYEESISFFKQLTEEYKKDMNVTTLITAIDLLKEERVKSDL